MCSPLPSGPTYLAAVYVRSSDQAHRCDAQGILGYFAVHATQECLRFDGHCALLMYDATDHEFEVLSHVSGDRHEKNHETFSVSWTAPDAETIMTGPLVHRCFMLTHGGSHKRVDEVRDRGVRSAPVVGAAERGTADAIEQLVALLEEADLVRGRSVLVFPLFQGSEALGMLVVSAVSSDAFSLPELTSGWELALACIPSLSRASRLVRDFQILFRVRARAHELLQHDVPLEENRPLTATLSLLCERLQLGAGR